MSTTKTDTTLAMPPPPLKIAPHEYDSTPSSSAVASPVENYVGKQVLEPWEKMVSRVSSSSVDSSMMSEPVWEEDEEELGEKEEQPTATNANVAKKMQTLVRTMQQRLQGLQRLVQEAKPQQELESQTQKLESSSQSTETSSSCAIPAEKSSVDGVGCAADVPEPQELVPVKSGSSDAATDEADVDTSSSSDEEDPPAMSTLLDRINALQSQLQEAADENQQLRGVIHGLAQENARLQADVVSTALARASEGQNSNGNSFESNNDLKSNGGGEDRKDDILLSTTAIFGEASAFQLAMEQDLSALKDHERCQHKLHELWETIRTLRTFVETYELERNTMRMQRDEAIIEANRAGTENAKLAGSSNPQQKIKYLQQVKKDNEALRRKNRALNAKICRLSAEFIRQRNGCSLLEEDSLCSSGMSDSTSPDETLQSSDDRSERTRTQILQSMWDRSGVLQQRLERLRLTKHSIGDTQQSLGDPVSNESWSLAGEEEVAADCSRCRVD
ncbi:hypothetical protein PHYBOEH_010321 [Phytophthora boehmeriae]|uniref:Uncharacterized protein n=1 Tax=Phytophthora boehmeriae TaxID=109152 RepID=A0A8T1XC41_9STRA|nr:hypothetical protein PHYBOEH_010321 [Phytophthora boehmeriae]